jgi:hypothetical protein
MRSKIYIFIVDVLFYRIYMLIIYKYSDAKKKLKVNNFWDCNLKKIAIFLFFAKLGKM